MASHVDRHNGGNLPQCRHHPQVYEVVHPLDGTGHDDIGPQRGDRPGIRIPRRTDDLDVTQSSSTPHDRRTKTEQQRADLVIGGDEAPDHRRGRHGCTGGIDERPPPTATAADEAREQAVALRVATRTVCRWHDRIVSTTRSSRNVTLWRACREGQLGSVGLPSPLC